MKTERNIQLYQLTRPVEREGDKYQQAFLIIGATLDLESWPHEDIQMPTPLFIPQQHRLFIWGSRKRQQHLPR